MLHYETIKGEKMKKTIILVAMTLAAVTANAKDYFEVYNNENKVNRGIELTCLLENESYDAKAYCYNGQYKIKFYTTFKSIKTKYNILHEEEVSTNQTNMRGLPNGTIAHKRIWITKK